MTTNTTEHGHLRPDGDRCAVRFERLYDFTAEELWSALTDPDQLPRWLGTTSRGALGAGDAFELVPGGEYELDVGGRVHGHVRTVEPGRVLELTWTWGDEPESVVRFEIVPRDHGALLVLDHSRLPRDLAVAYGAGWHAHLDLLDAALGGRTESWDGRYRALRPAYEERAAALGWVEMESSPVREALYRGDRAAAEAAAAGQELDVFDAAALGRADRLRELLDADPGLVHAISNDGFTPLHLACFSGGAEATRLLVERGADAEAMSRHPSIQVRPLGTAAFIRDRESARVLLDAGADPNGEGEGGFVPLHTAAQNGDVELISLLLERGADAQRRAPDGRTPEQLAREAGHEDCAALLANAPAASGRA